MFNIKKLRRRTHMETTIDVKGLPEGRIQYLKNLIALWQKQDAHSQQDEEDDVKPSDFIVKHSNVKGGEVTRAMAYE